MKLSMLLKPFEIQVTEDCEITGLHNDSRQINPGYLFIAYKGELADGRQYISKAIEAGAKAIVYDPVNCSEDSFPSGSVPIIPFPEVSNYLGQLSSIFFGEPVKALDITGITGTNGKTTIAYMLTQAYAFLGDATAYIGTLGHGAIDAMQPLQNTTPDGLVLHQLFNQYKHEGVKQVCMEVSSHALSLNRVDKVKFDTAVFTNLSHEHLDFHHTFEAYANAKARLFAWPGLKFAVINADDAHSELMKSKLRPDCKLITYGVREKSDVAAKDIRLSVTGSSFTIVSQWGDFPLTIKVIGLFNIYNALAVFSCLMVNGYSSVMVLDVMSKLEAVPGRMKVVSQSPGILVDFAHTPDALDNALSTLTELKTGRIITVFGCGGERDKEKRPIMGKIASQYSDVLIITSDNPRREDPLDIINQIEAGVAKEDTYVLSIINRKEAIEKAISMAEADDMILIAGKGHESYQQIGLERFDFSDQNIVEKILSAKA
jgi:UDP-N-acetylmuramoyl-L-alanyl-D-glutamate--2,6-diaminopimelate ligase